MAEDLWDVIVVGAGPAGASAAEGCAKAGLRTLVLDSAEFPRDKPCGGMIDVTALDTIPGVESVVERRTELSRTFLNYEFVEEHLNRNLMVRRTTFDELLARSAQRAGADLREGHKVEAAKVADGRVEVACAGGQVFHGRLLIDAAGAKSPLFAQHKRAVERTIKYKIVSMVLEAPCPNDVMERRMGFDTAAGRTYFFSHIMTGFIGYGWLFPKDGAMNAGLGTISTRSAGLKPAFKEFLERSGFGDLDFSLATAGLIPVKVLPQLWLPHVLFVGDAGGFVDAMTGGGIMLGIASGRRAAVVAKEAVEANDLSGERLRAFQVACRDLERELARKTRTLKWVSAGVEWGLDSPRMTKWVLRTFQRKYDSSESKRR